MNLGESLRQGLERGAFGFAGGGRKSGEVFAGIRELPNRGRRERRLRILILESDPFAFVCALATTLREGHHAFLGNRNWGRNEMQSVEEQVRPDLISRDGVWIRGEEWERDVNFPEGNEVYIGIPTGGTGGTLRIALHTEGTLGAAVDGFRRFFGVDQLHSTCLLPLFHVSGLMQVVRAVSTGGSVAFAPSSSRDGGIMPLPETSAPAFLSLVPTQLSRFVSSPSSLEWLRRFHVILLGGAPTPPQLLEAGRKAGLRLAPAYGMTETAAAVCILHPEAFLEDCTLGGEVLPHASIWVDGTEETHLSPAGGGRLIIESPSLFRGYFPQVVPLLEEWYSGDLGYVNEKGRLQVVGRVRPSINTGGEKVDPAEVEQVLLASGRVSDVHVVGVLDDEWGEAVAALFVPAGELAGVGELTALLRLRLTSYKIPKIWIPLKQLPRNMQGKLDREEIHAQLSQWQSSRQSL